MRGIERLRAEALKADAKLGAKRPAEVTAMLAALDAGAESARRLRLARDQWRLREPEYRSYRRAVAAGVARAAARATPPLEDIRAQAGPGAEHLEAGDERASTRRARRWPARRRRRRWPRAHALLQSAWDLADNAFKLRLRAVETGDSARAAEASAAAAGALMLMARAREDIDQALKPPSLP